MTMTPPTLQPGDRVMCSSGNSARLSPHRVVSVSRNGRYMKVAKVRPEKGEDGTPFLVLRSCVTTEDKSEMWKQQAKRVNTGEKLFPLAFKKGGHGKTEGGCGDGG